jgi:hypothetical protein
MAKLNGNLKGDQPNALKFKIGDELKAAAPPWETIQPQTQEYLKLTTDLAKEEPRRGTKESWAKLTAGYTEAAAALDKAAQEKNKDAALAAHQALGTLCNGCHQAHLLRPPGGMPPGGMPPGGPPSAGVPDLGKPLAKPLLAALDTDKDGTVSKDELVAGVKKFFKLCDKEGKGTLGQPQITEGLKAILPPPDNSQGDRPGFDQSNFLSSGIQRQADTNHDGMVTQDELVAAAEKLFAEMDKDKKGKLDEAALAEGIRKVAQLRFMRPDFGQPPGGPPRPKEGT